MSKAKKDKLIHYVLNHMSKKDKGRKKKPAMTNKWGKVIRRGK